jgi:hypothetical protein
MDTLGEVYVNGDRSMSSRTLRRIRNYSFICALIFLLLVIALTILGQRQPVQDEAFAGAIAVMVGSGMVFAVLSYVLILRDGLRSDRGAGEISAKGRKATLGSPQNPVVIVIAITAVLVNVVAIVRTGSPNLLGILLAGLVAGLLVLIQWRARHR